MQKRRRFKQSTLLKEQLTSFAQEARDQVANLSPCAERDVLLKKARQADTASHLEDWANSPELQPPI
jgi:hypothetical protein